MNNKIKSFQDACLIAGVVYKHNQLLTTDENAFIKLKIIAKAFNGNCKPNCRDGNQPKYWPVFNISDSTKKDENKDWFWCTNYGASFGGGAMPESILFTDKQDAVYAGKLFEHIYKEYILG
jgi:hypothetical protein